MSNSSVPMIPKQYVYIEVIITSQVSWSNVFLKVMQIPLRGIQWFSSKFREILIPTNVHGNRCELVGSHSLMYQIFRRDLRKIFFKVTSKFKPRSIVHVKISNTIKHWPYINRIMNQLRIFTQRTDGMGDALDRVFLAMGEIVHWVDLSQASNRIPLLSGWSWIRSRLNCRLSMHTSSTLHDVENFKQASPNSHEEPR